MAQSLFDKYGGFETFSAVVSNFYQKVLDSEELRPYFEGIKMERLMSHQTNFISLALGGPNKYEGRDIVEAHGKLHISEPHFMEVVDLLDEALEEGGVEEQDVASINAIVMSLKAQIVSH